MIAIGALSVRKNNDDDNIVRYANGNSCFRQTETNVQIIHAPVSGDSLPL